MVRPIDAWYLASTVEEKYWQATAATAGFGAARYAFTGSTAQLRTAYQMASFGFRAHMAAVRGVFGTPLVSGGVHTLGTASMQGASAIALGYTIGAVVGTGISQLAFGDEGAQVALELYSSPTDFWEKALHPDEFFGNIQKIGRHYWS